MPGCRLSPDLSVARFMGSRPSRYAVWHGQETRLPQSRRHDRRDDPHGFASALVLLWGAVLVGWVGRALQVEEKTPYGRRLRRIGLVLLVVALVVAAAAARLLVS